MSDNVVLRKLDGMTMTLSVTVSRELRFRIWCASYLIRLAGWIMGSHVEIKDVG